MNLLVGGEEFVQRSGRSHLHDQHKTVCVAQAKHADDERVTQLVHDLCLPHHLLLHQLLVVVLQHLDGHVYLTPESKQNTGSDISRRTHARTAQRLFLKCSAPHDSVLKTPFLTQPKFPEPSSTSSISRSDLWMLNLLISLGLWYGLNPLQSMGRRSRSSGTVVFVTNARAAKYKLHTINCMYFVCRYNVQNISNLKVLHSKSRIRV